MSRPNLRAKPLLPLQACIYGLPGIRYRKPSALAALRAARAASSVDFDHASLRAAENDTLVLRVSTGDCIAAEIVFPSRAQCESWLSRRAPIEVVRLINHG